MANSGKQPARAVLDTSSLVPARLRRDLQQAGQLGLYQPIWSPWIIAELTRRLTWQWIERHGADLSGANWKRCSEAANAMMVRLISTFEVVAPVPPYPPAWDHLRDTWDHPIWAAAKAGSAGYVVSENTRDFPPGAPDGRYMHQGIEYIRADAFLALVLDER